jgi:hypothetical protein
MGWAGDRYDPGMLAGRRVWISFNGQTSSEAQGAECRHLGFCHLRAYLPIPPGFGSQLMAAA